MQESAWNGSIIVIYWYQSSVAILKNTLIDKGFIYLAFPSIKITQTKHSVFLLFRKKDWVYIFSSYEQVHKMIYIIFESMLLFNCHGTINITTVASVIIRTSVCVDIIRNFFN